MTKDFDDLLRWVAAKLGCEIEYIEDDKRYKLTATLSNGRKQRVYLGVDEDTIRFSTKCGGWLQDIRDRNLYRKLLTKNYRLKHGFFAIGPDKMVELVDTQLLETCDPEELIVSIINLAVLGDLMEQEFDREGLASQQDIY